jgi:hypothetical protein
MIYMGKINLTKNKCIPNNSAIRIPLRVAFDEYMGPMPFFSSSTRFSTLFLLLQTISFLLKYTIITEENVYMYQNLTWWKSKTMWALSEIHRQSRK